MNETGSMNEERWKRVDELLQAALEIAPHHRDEFLRQACSGDSELIDEIKSLLTSCRNAGDFLESPAIDVESRAVTIEEQSSQLLVGQIISQYRILKMIGSGGMGSVWRAERCDGRFERNVAIKFIHMALSEPASTERFKREGKILGKLAHPQIAQLIDAGVTAKGEPYLVLEYVEGKPIDQYCDEHQLNIESRIRLFLDVLTAVAHAHSNLVVHRDIKPSNVLVRSDGQVKLLDFGIAKLLAADEANPATMTIEGGVVLTPRFAAPEQLTEGTITTATDVYALGVLLYILLTDQHPAGPGPHSAAQLLQAILEQEPARASDAVSAVEAGRRANRATTADKLQRQLRGDLDTILAKALKKSPAERYASAAALADDLRRYLRHEPISARADTVAYRARKFIRRNRTVVALTTGAVVLVIGSLSAGLYVANRERRIAEHRFLQVRQLANKFIDLDNDIRGLPGTTKIRMQMVSDSLQYLTSLGSDIHGDKDLTLDIASAYVRVAHAQGNPTSPNLGLFADAEVSLDKGETFVNSVLKTDRNNKRALMIATTIAHDHMVLADEQNRRAEMLWWANKASERVERFMRLSNTDAGDIYGMAYFESNIAFAYDHARRFADALRAGERALEISRPVPSAQGIDGGALEALTVARWQAGDLEGALHTAQQSLELMRVEAANGHVSLRANLADALKTEGMILGKEDAEPSLGRTRDALAAFQTGMDIGEELAKMDAIDYLSRRTVASLGLEIGNILRHTEPQKALAVYDHTLARVREAKTNISTELYEADLLAGSSYAARWVGRKREARRRIDEAFQLLRDAGQFPADTVEPMSQSDHVLRAAADDYAEAGQTENAIAAYRELLDKLMAWKPDVQNDLRDATCVSRTWTALAGLLRRTGHREEADRLEAQRTELWNHWNDKLPNAQFLLRQSLRQVSPPHPSSLFPAIRESRLHNLSGSAKKLR